MSFEANVFDDVRYYNVCIVTSNLNVLLWSQHLKIMKTNIYPNLKKTEVLISNENSFLRITCRAISKWRKIKMGRI